MPGLGKSNSEIPAQRAEHSLMLPFSHASILRTLSASTSVRTHLDFYRWLQNDVSEFIPHQTLLAVWGNFQTEDLSYDVTSSIPGINTHMVPEVEGISAALARLFEIVRLSGRGWTVIKDYHSLATDWGISVGSPFYQIASARTPCLLACAMHDKRGNHDCLYIFSNTDCGTLFDPLMLELLIPHLDAALRRVECLQSGSRDADTPANSVLSGREREVLEWVSQGKSNEEIGVILNISHNTVKNHLKRIFSKMGVSARSQAVGLYLRNRSAAL